MKNLFLVDGAAGTGKTDMLDYVKGKYSRNQVVVVTKYATRKHRHEEVERGLSLDLKFVSPNKFASLKAEADFYSYCYGGHEYGFSGKDVDLALSNHQNVFVIVRDRTTIQEIRSAYPKINVVPVFIYTDREQCEKRLSDDGYDSESIQFRLSRQEIAWDDYLRHFGLYQEVIINNSNKNDFHRLIDALIDKYSHESSSLLVISNCEKFPLLKSLIGFKDEIIKRVAEYDQNVFLMMKFRDRNTLVYGYIKEVLEERGLNCIRADEHEWDITRNTYNPLAVLYCCKFGIALFDEPEEGNNFSRNNRRWRSAH